MAPETSTYRRIVELVDAALDLDTSARGAFLDQACRDEPALRAEVDSLLEEETALAGEFLEQPAVLQAVERLAEGSHHGLGTLDDVQPTSAPTEAVGPYRVLRELGRGGMGTVYLAEQREPIERRIALKVIRGFEGDQGVRRLAAECKALARLKHPNIAAVYDAGVTDNGQAFVAMEWIEGSHITEWCDQHRLPLQARIELFLGVCAGVGHAHQRGLIHRDLKPANVLVAEVDGKATAKVIDFGIARSLDDVETVGSTNSPGTGQGTGVGQQTNAGQGMGVGTGVTHGASQLMGSPIYMSPEAASLSDRSGVDVRTDVYSLGILLYELLVGVPPHEVSGLGMGALLRQAQTTDPPTLSRRWADLPPDHREELAHRRGVGVQGLQRQLRGDLDAILAKATARHRDARYALVSDLAADLQRTLQSRPVEAREPSLGYNTSRYVRRNWGVITAVLLVIGVLLAGVVARTREAERANLEAETARQALAEAEQVSEFLIGLFEVVDPDQADDDPQSVDELLAKAEASMAEELADHPLARARFMQTIGRIAMTRMDLDRAATLYEEALTLRELHSPGDHSEIITNVGSLGVIYRRQGRLDEAEAMLVRAVELHDAMRDPDPGKLAATLTWLANLHHSQTRYDEAIAGHRRALELRRAKTPDNLGAIAESLNNLGVALRDAEQYAEARTALQEAETLFARVFGVEHPWVVGCWLNLAGIEEQLGHWQEAEGLLVRAGETWHELHGPVHHRTLLARRALGALWRRWSRTDEAMAHLSRLLAEQTTLAADDRLEIGRTLVELGRAHQQAGRLEAAQDSLQQARAIYSDLYGHKYIHSHRIRALLALVEWDRGHLAEAAQDFEHLSTEILRQHGERHPLSPWMLNQLGAIRLQQEQLDSAETALVRANTIYESLSDRPTVAMARNLVQLGRLRHRQGRTAEGSALDRQASRIFEELLPAGHPERESARNDTPEAR